MGELEEELRREIEEEDAPEPEKRRRRKRKRKRRCGACGETLTKGDRFCDACGAVVMSDDEDSRYRREIEPALAKGRKWIAIVGVMYVFGGLVFYATTEEPLVLWINLALAAIHGGLWHWGKSNLLPAAISALVLFISVHLLNAVLDPTTIAQGILIKGIFIVVLARAVSAGLEARRLQRGGTS